MLLVNPQTAFQWTEPLDINGIQMMGIREKQGHSFSRAGYLAAKQNSELDADEVGRTHRQQLRPYSQSTLLKARREYEKRTVPTFPRYFIIEPTNVCNKVCPFCTITVMERVDSEGKIVKGFMKWDTYMCLMSEPLHISMRVIPFFGKPLDQNLDTKKSIQTGNFILEK